MLVALGKMTDANQKEMLAGLFLSKFNTEESKAGLERLGYDTFQDAYKGLAELVGGTPLSVRNYRDEFDPVFPNGRTGYNMRKMHPTRQAMLDANDYLIVVDITGKARDGWLPQKAWDWIRDNN